MLKLPDLVLFEIYNGNWEQYVEALYCYFKQDFLDNKINNFRGMRVGLKKYPEFKNKAATFWHLISEGKDESQRTPDLRRCERTRWPKQIIENNYDESVKVWENTRGLQDSICLCYGSWEYLVVLRKRAGYVLPWTAYYPHSGRTKSKWEKEYREYCQKANTAP